MEARRKQPAAPHAPSPAKARVSGITIARRSAMYVVRTLLFIIMGLIICIAAFLTAERYSNLYILTNEGMALRAECILADGAKNDLEEYFTLSLLAIDRVTNDDTYSNYTISSYNYDLTIEKISVLPWSMTANVTAVERVTLKGALNANQLEDEQLSNDYPPPVWTPVRYRIGFLNVGERWYINSLEVLEENPVQDHLGTPDPNQKPIPAATPTPSVTLAPTLAPSTHAADAVTTLAP